MAVVIAKNQISKLEISVTDSHVSALAYTQSVKSGHQPLFAIIEPYPSIGLEAIYNARIDSINFKTGLAFVTYALDKVGIVNLHPDFKLQSGCFLPLQMVWAGSDNKLPKFSLELKLTGKYVIILLNSCEPKFAKNLVNRSRLDALLIKYNNLGLIFRSSIDKLSDLQIVEDEINSLNEQYKAFKSSKVSQITRPVYQFIKLLRELNLASDLAIISNNQEICEDLIPYSKNWGFAEPKIDYELLCNIPDITDNMIQTSDFKLEIHRLSGINLIDINSSNNSNSFYQVNYLSIDEILRQIYLRDLTGIILLDFIKNMTVEEEGKILEKLHLTLKSDWRRSQVLGFTKAGICEIIRNK